MPNLETFTFTPHIFTKPVVPYAVKVAAGTAPVTIEELAEETGVYSASPEFVRKHCGPVANTILDQVPESFYAECDKLNMFPNVDVRIHRLYPGDYPAVPGWHCDGEYRENYHSQPDLTRLPDHSHIVCSVSTDADGRGVSNTEIVTEALTATVNMEDGERFWQQVHNQVQQRQQQTQDAQNFSTVMVGDGTMVVFSSRTLHRATPARVRGWRLFFRMSMWHKPYLGDGGKISRQEQVYRLTENLGW